MEQAMPYFLVAVAAFLATYLCVPPVKLLARRLGAIDYPSKRRINTKPIPRLGGLAMFAGLCLALVVEIAGIKLFGWPPILIPHPSMTINYPLLGVAFLIIVITGAVDDVRSLSPKKKLLGQIVAACVAATAGLLIGNIVNPFIPGAEIDLGWFAYPITVIYLVAFTNTINLIDGLDGLAAGISGIASLSMFSFAVLAGRLDAASLAIALFGACLAFLRYNFHPASIFMGDSGSLLLGFGLGTISLLNVSRTAALTSLIIPLIVAGVPILNTLSAIVRRKRAHVSIGQADKGHVATASSKRGMTSVRRSCSSTRGACCSRWVRLSSTRLPSRRALRSSLRCSPVLRFSRRAFICSSLFYGITTTQRRSKTKS